MTGFLKAVYIAGQWVLFIERRPHGRYLVDILRVEGGQRGERGLVRRIIGSAVSDQTA